MPDLINFEHNKGKREHIVWHDELCASCLNVGSCPLLQVMHDNTIYSYSGMHVAHCDNYEVDVASDWYIDPNAPPDMENVKRVNRETEIQQFKRTLGAFEGMLKQALERRDG